jgi:hypothetical protein
MKLTPDLVELAFTVLAPDLAELPLTVLAPDLAELAFAVLAPVEPDAPLPRLSLIETLPSTVLLSCLVLVTVFVYISVI